MEERWIIRPLHSFIYQKIRSMIGRRRSRGRGGYITLEDLMDDLKENRIEVDIDEVLSTLLKLEIWEYIDVNNNGATLEIRLRRR